MKKILRHVFILNLLLCCWNTPNAFSNTSHIPKAFANTCVMNDSLILVDLYNATSGANWTTTWDLSQPLSTWSNVFLDANGCVTELHLQNQGLVGTLPVSLGNLTNLEYLYLYNNSISGTIPPELGNLTNLIRYSIYNNQLTGTIPSELGNLSNLELLFLSGNQLTGVIPPELGNLTNLIHCTLYSNDLTGGIPPELGNMSSLETLRLSSSNLTGTIPTELGNLTNLTELRLDNNQLIGQIPSVMGNLTNLTKLYMNNNQFSGSLPASLGNLVNLQYGILSYNQLTGDIPPSYANLTSLIQLSIHNNQLSGCYDNALNNLCNSLSPIHNSNANISTGNNFDAPWEDFCSTGMGVCGLDPCVINDSLALVALYDATDGPNWVTPWNLNQPMSTWGGVELTATGCVENLFLTARDLVGTLPPELSTLDSLKLLILNQNTQISGGIPPEMGDFASLEVLLLSNVWIGGTIPPELGNLSTLTHLYLDGCQLTGEIPPELSNASSLLTISFKDNQLTGTIPASFPNSSIINMALYDNQLSGCYDAGLQTLCSQLGTNSSNFAISNGNNFDAPWEDFCNTGAGTCVTPCLNDYNAMVAFANAITSWGSTTPWDLNQPMGTWDGVTVNTNGCVTSINLDENYTAGTLPPELGNLSSLQTLHLGDNSFIGTIPPELGNLSNLTYLNLDGNNLTGNIPPELGNLTLLTNLYLSYNQLTGSIPAELGNLINLAAIGMHHNQLTGCYPSTITNMCAFAYDYNISDGNSFDVPWEYFCNTSTCVVPCLNDYNAMVAFANAITTWGSTTPWDLNQPMGTWDGVTVDANGCVTSINLDENYTAGTLPPELGNLSSLQTLHLGDNSFIGAIPPELGNLSNLTYLNLDGNNLTGNIPPELGNLTLLTNLYLSYNQLTGSIPAELGNLINLTAIGMHHNQLTGCYPSALINMCAFANNFNISNGNNFDAPWEDFCLNGAGACEDCPNLYLFNPLITRLYQAGQILLSESIAPTGTDVQFKAEDVIILDKGFTVEPGSSFSGEIEDCIEN